MADFSIQEINDGVGDIRLNRFRIAFETPPGHKLLAGDLIDQFPAWFRSKHAHVTFGDRSFEGKRTLRFHGYAKLLIFDDIAPEHDDWVFIEWADRTIGLTVQTLKREFFLAGDDIKTTAKAAAAVVFIPVIGQGLGLAGALGVGAVGVHYNRMHFLAGKRSWRIGAGDLFGMKGDVMVLETVAIERFAARPFMTVDAIAGLESKIADVWIAMLDNFVSLKGLRPVAQPLKPGWQRRNRVDYVFHSFGSANALYANPEFQDVFKLYRTILPREE